MGQLQLFDERKLFLCEWNHNFEVLNGDDFKGNFVKILSYPKVSVDKRGFEIAVQNCFGIVREQIVWLKPEEIPRVNSKCSKCKKIKSFQKWEVEHYPENKVCHNCLMNYLSSDDWKKSHLEDKEFMEEMRRQECN